MSSPIVASSITKASAFCLSILSTTLSDYKSLLIDMVLNKFDTSLLGRNINEYTGKLTDRYNFEC